MSYPSKILLFGEYTVLEGSKALAIPYPHLSGRWSTCDKQEDLFNKIAQHIMNHGRTEFLSAFDIERFRNDIANRLCFESDIPSGYGIGSSGSLTAAIFDTYCDHADMELRTKMNAMAMIESFFHGNSSGLDPLISFLKKPVLLGDERISFPKVNIEGALKNVFLYNSEISRSTQEYVSVFSKLKENTEFLDGYRLLVDLNNSIVEKILQDEKFDEQFKMISELQLEHFAPMIPEKVLGLWMEGLKSDKYYFKLCGAGGGGFFLVYRNGSVKDELNVQLLPIGMS